MKSLKTIKKLEIARKWNNRFADANSQCTLKWDGRDFVLYHGQIPIADNPDITELIKDCSEYFELN